MYMPNQKINVGYNNLPVIFMKEGKVFIAYTPALDLSAHGRSIDEAKKNFSEVLSLFLEELVEHDTLGRVLENMGWKKKQSQWQPPVGVEAVTSVPFRVPVAA